MTSLIPKSAKPRAATIRETVYKSLDKLLLWNKESENSKYLELALLHMQAYANMGFALDEENKTIREILKKTGKTREDFYRGARAARP